MKGLPYDSFASFIKLWQSSPMKRFWIREYNCPKCAPYEDFEVIHNSPALKTHCSMCGGAIKFVQTLKRGFVISPEEAEAFKRYLDECRGMIDDMFTEIQLAYIELLKARPRPPKVEIPKEVIESHLKAIAFWDSRPPWKKIPVFVTKDSPMDLESVKARVALIHPWANENKYRTDTIS